MFLIIDGFSLLFRAFYGIPDMVSPTGLPTNALYGFMNQAMRAIQTYSPDYMCLCLDSPGKSVRHTLYEAYKANRSDPPDLLKRQLAVFEDTMAQTGVPLWRQSGIEADDLVGSLATQYANADQPVVIMSSDMDLLQLVSPLITVMVPSKGNLVQMTPDTVVEKYQIRPDQIVSYKALKGDPSDNIPGVLGIGDKTAVKLLNQYESLVGIYDAIDRIKPAGVQKKLQQNHESATLSFQLASLTTDLPAPALETYAYRLDIDKWQAVWQTLGFDSLIKRYGNAPVPVITETPSYTIERPPQYPLSAFGDYWDDLKSGMAISLDATKQTLSIACRTALFVSATPADTLQEINRLETAHGPLPVYTYNAQHLYKALPLTTVLYDAMIAAFLLDSSQSLTLPALAKRYLGSDLSAIDNGTQACVILQLMQTLMPRLDDNQLTDLFKTVECPLAPVLAAMSQTGIAVDATQLDRLGDTLEAERDALTQRIYSQAGMVFSITSPQQLGRVLFDHLKLPVIKQNKTGPSTDNSVLTQLNHPVVTSVLRYRTIDKLLTTYIRVLPKLIQPETGCIHTAFNQVAVVTGRLSSRNPNLQTIPIRSDDGYAIRAAFVPRDPSHCIIAADYSQIELRILAHYSQDPGLLAAYDAGVDSHQQTAAKLFGVPLDQVTKTQRSQAKTVNFGIIYGQSAFSLATQLGISREKAKQLITAYFKTFPAVRVFIDETIATAIKQQGVHTALGRWRALPDLASPKAMIRAHARRTAVNTVIQGTAADMIKVAMIRLQAALATYKTKLILQVHDEVLLDGPLTERDTVADLVRDTMSHAMPLSVPITVSIASGQNWRDMHLI